VIRIDRRSHLEPAEVAEVQALLDMAGEVDGVSPLDEQRWLELTRGGGEGFSALLARDADDHLAAYAQLHRQAAKQGSPRWSLAVATDPRDRRGGRLSDEVAEAARASVRAAGGGTLDLWVSQPRPEHERMALVLGLEAGRVLYQMRRPLPLDESFAIETRAFRPGTDEPAWLEVNNRAFAWHPEQGGWDLAAIEEHESLPWFDPTGFLIYEVDGRMAGFCWTKIHADARQPMGEIYVIAADPDFAGGGLGRRLTLAGLDDLARRGISIGMLYVDADNIRAVKLYVGMGFVVHHIDTTFSGTIAGEALDAAQEFEAAPASGPGS
jgi:mycothiol synthase